MKYAKKRGLPTEPERKKIEDVKIEGILLPKYHPKDTVTFSNCKFSRCILKLGCWCGITFVNCLFDQCIITGKLANYDVSAYGCVFQDCITEGAMSERLRGFIGAEWR